MKRNPCCKFTIEVEKEIVKEYVENKIGTTIIGRKYGCDASTVSNILRHYGVQMRTLREARNAQRELDLEAFKEITKPEQAYWLGVMYTDGYISTSRGTDTFALTIAEKDKEWLEKFRSFLKTNIEVKTYTQESGFAPGTLYSRLAIGCPEIVADLKRLGVIERKTAKINKMPNIPYLDDFVRGVVDGDGSIRTENGGLRIYGNKDFLVDIAEYLGEPYKITPDKMIFCLGYGLPISRKLLKRLYENSTVYLQRKYELAKKHFNSLSIE